jgi:hypothetical protein
MKKAIIALSIILVASIGANVTQGYFACRKGPGPVLTSQHTGKTQYQNKCDHAPIDITGRMISDVLEVTASTSTPECGGIYNQAWFNFTCPVFNYKHSLTFAPGLYLIYDIAGKRFWYAPGGALGYTRHWGRFGFGAMIQVWCTTNTDMFGGAINAQIQYRW